MKTKSGKQIIAKLTLMIITFFFVSGALAQHKAPWNAPESAKARKNPFLPDSSSLFRGKKSYKLDCLQCHGKQGKGDGPNAFKVEQTVADLSADTVQNQSDGELYWKISEGRDPMPLAKRTLTDDQRWDVINYLRTFKKKQIQMPVEDEKK